MSTSRQFTIKKHFPTKFRFSAEGYYNKVIQVNIDNDEVTKNIEMTLWPVPELTYTNSESCPGTVSLNSGDFCDYSTRKSDIKVLMPYDNGRIYSTPTPVYNEHLEIIDCTVTNGIASNFSLDNYLHLLNINFSGTWEIFFTINVGNIDSNTRALFGQLTNNRSTPQIEISQTRIWLGLASSTSSWDICSNYFGIDTLEVNSNHTIKLSFDGSKYQLFLDDNVVGTINSSTPIYYETDQFVIGRDAGNTYFPGTIDLNNSHIIVNGLTLWEYPQTTYQHLSLNGCLVSSDTSSTHTYTGYTIKTGVDQRIVLADSAPVISGSTAYKLTNITIPAHDTYSYSETSVYTPGNLTIVGNSSCWDDTNKIFTGENEATYMSVGNSLSSSDNFEALFKVQIDDVSSNSALFGSNPNGWWLGVKTGTVGGWLPSGGGFTTSTTIETGLYYFKYVNTTDGFKIYCKKNSMVDMPLVYSSGKVSFSCTDMILGANYNYWYENLHGNLYLRDSYFKLNDNLLFGTTVTPVWTKENH